jgi:putative hydrolase of the HAD superfamily
MGEIHGERAERVREKTEKLIYRGWEDHFKKIRLFPHVEETLDAMRKNGITLGLLSDFPPETKLKNLKIFDFWDVVICSEEAGFLKPDTAAFLEIAKRMDTAPGQILYVGNSVSYDVAGAHKAGMKAALVCPAIGRTSPFLPKRKKAPSFVQNERIADFIFSDYRQLLDYVLN